MPVPVKDSMTRAPGKFVSAATPPVWFGLSLVYQLPL
jgi:hypothetical protein